MALLLISMSLMMEYPTMKWLGLEPTAHGGTKWNWSWLVKVGDLQVGCLYRMSSDPRVGYRFGATPLEEASRLALFVLKRNSRQNAHKVPDSRAAEPWVYLGTKMVYGGLNGDKAIMEKVHHFVRPNGKRIYIYGEHIKHIKPFTQG